MKKTLKKPTNPSSAASRARPKELPRVKVIKRYGNRKLYDTEQSVYVVLKDIAKMIRNRENVQIIDNITDNDITHATLTQIIFGAEQKTSSSASLDILKSIIKEGDGSFSSFLARIGLSDTRRKGKGRQMTKRGRAGSIGERVAFGMEKAGEGIPHLPGNGLRHR